MSTSKKIEARREYQLGHLDESMRSRKPMEVLSEWLELAKEHDPEDYNAMCLSTVTERGGVNSRIVLLREIEGNCLRFFTNYDSAKGRQLIGNPSVAINFFWKELERQIRITGIASMSSSEVSNEYFASRPWESQIGSWCSLQSQADVHPDIMTRREALVQKFQGLTSIPRPENWGGFDVAIDSIEFWQGRPSRLHDRWRFSKTGTQQDWLVERLDP